MYIGEVISMSFEEQYDTHFDEIFRYIFYMTASKELAEDLTQETFMRFYRSDFRGESSVRTYVHQIARRIVYDHFRRKKLIQWLPFTQKHEQATTALEDVLIIKEEHEQLYNALQQLKLSYKDVLIYRKLEGYSIQQTAHILGWSETKVSNTQRSAMKQLQLLLGGMQDEA